MDNTIYNRKFYKTRHDDTLYAANKLLALFFEKICKPQKTIIDIGCGVGTFLSVCKEQYKMNVCGIDGPWVPKDLLKIDEDEFYCIDINMELDDYSSRLWRCDPADAAICLEVAEHINEQRSDLLVKFICTHCNFALFSAAIPGQTGQGHINEQWPSFWASLFKKYGFLMFDVLRTKLWFDDDIPAWYRQNSFIVINHSHLNELTEVNVKNLVIDARHDVIHPGLYPLVIQNFLYEQK